MAEKKDQKMYYRMLGQTGLQVSVLSFGFWATFGVKDGLRKEVKIISRFYTNLFIKHKTWHKTMIYDRN